VSFFKNGIDLYPPGVGNSVLVHSLWNKSIKAKLMTGDDDDDDVYEKHVIWAGKR